MKKSHKEHRKNGSILLATATMVILATLIAIAAGKALRSSVELHVAEQEAAKHGESTLDALRALLADLTDQIDDIHSGEQPTTEQPYELYEYGGGFAVGALLEVSEQELGGSEYFVPLASRVNVNVASREMLEELGVLSDAAIESILRARDEGPLRDLSGVLQEGSQVGQGDDSLGSLEPGDVLTAWSFDLEMPVDETLREALGGEYRIDLSAEAVDVNELIEIVRDEVDAGAANALAAVFESSGSADSPLASRADVAFRLLNSSVTPEALGGVLDLVRFSDSSHTAGRIDLNGASAEVLASLPGLTSEEASLIVLARDTLDSEETGRVTWPLEQQIVRAEVFAEFVDLVTTRSTQFEVRVGLQIEDDGGGRFDFSSLSNEEGFALPPALESLPVSRFRAVVDVGLENVRVLDVRDESLLLYKESMERARMMLQQASEESRLDATFEEGDRGVARVGGIEPGGADVEQPGESSVSFSDLARWLIPQRDAGGEQ